MLANQIVPYVSSGRVCAGREAQVAVKWRLTTDLSWPHSGAMIEGGIEVDVVNQAMDRSAWPANRMMRVIELAEAAAILLRG